jgi:hypothetical protein
MTRKKQIKPGGKVGLKLTPAERMLLLSMMPGLTERIRDVLRATPTTRPVMLTYHDLSDLEGHVAAEANHTKGARHQRERIKKDLASLGGSGTSEGVIENQS